MVRFGSVIQPWRPRSVRSPPLWGKANKWRVHTFKNTLFLPYSPCPNASLLALGVSPVILSYVHALTVLTVDEHAIIAKYEAAKVAAPVAQLHLPGGLQKWRWTLVCSNQHTGWAFRDRINT